MIPTIFPKRKKIHITDVTEIKPPNSGSDLMQKWKIRIIIKIMKAKSAKFLK